MTSKEAQKIIKDIGIIPVVRADSVRQAILAVASVSDGGIPIVEITMTVPGALEVIADLARNNSAQLLIGAGTILDAEMAQRCIDAGAEFIVSPGLDVETVDLVKRHRKLMMAGALTPTEVIAAWNAGADFVKIFPCGNVGGPRYIRSLKGPLPQVPMVPTGGVNLETAADFIRAGSEALGIGGELVSSSALKSGNGSEITDLARRFLEIVREARHHETARTPFSPIAVAQTSRS